LHFPGVSPEAARLLVERRVDGVGIDTASLDHGPSIDFRTHRILSSSGIYGLENLAGLELLPPKGATVIALPMKIRGGTGGPVRVIALLP
jgi:kynurenine formamidase